MTTATPWRSKLPPPGRILLLLPPPLLPPPPPLLLPPPPPPRFNLSSAPLSMLLFSSMYLRFESQNFLISFQRLSQIREKCLTRTSGSPAPCTRREQIDSSDAHSLQSASQERCHGKQQEDSNKRTFSSLYSSHKKYKKAFKTMQGHNKLQSSTIKLFQPSRCLRWFCSRSSQSDWQVLEI